MIPKLIPETDGALSLALGKETDHKGQEGISRCKGTNCPR